jgi:hypothetical protein
MRFRLVASAAAPALQMKTLSCRPRHFHQQAHLPVFYEILHQVHLFAVR